uniref:Small integral membrane protein 12 n=1 Tax=Rhipicephalus pulchellus TaxID=72859 RepID=L7M5L1_RHIPC
MVLPALYAALRVYAPYVTFPVAVIVGIIGYNIEGLISDRRTPNKKTSIDEERKERLLHELDSQQDVTKVERLKDKTFVPKTVLERNVSPSLKTLDT